MDLGEAVDRADDPNYALFRGDGRRVRLGVWRLGSASIVWAHPQAHLKSTEKAVVQQLHNKDIAFFESNKQGELSVILEKDVSTTAEALTDKFAAGCGYQCECEWKYPSLRSSPELHEPSNRPGGVGAMTVRKYSKKLRTSYAYSRGRYYHLH